MSIKSIIKAGLLTASLITIAAPALARPDDDSRPERGQRGGGNENRGGGENRGNRGGDNGGDRDNGWRGGEARQAPAPAPAAQPAPAPVVRATPPAPTPAADNPRFQRGGNEQARPGSQQWYGQRGITPPPPAADRSNATPDRGRNQGSWQANGGRDRDNNDARNGNWNRDRNRESNGRDNGWNGNRDRNDRDNNWNRDRDGRDNNWRGNDNRNWNDNRGNWNNGRPGVRPPVANRWDGMRRWDNNGWRNDRRYDWRDWRNSHRSIFRLPSYRPPYGWNRSYSRFSIGIYLDGILFGQDYWIDDPWTYRLPPVYGTLRWVRYYDDALLIDIRDGYVVDVIYDFFW